MEAHVFLHHVLLNILKVVFTENYSMNSVLH